MNPGRFSSSGFVIVLLITLSFPFWGKTAIAASFQLKTKPYLSMEGLWDSNVFNTAGGDSDYLVRATPGIGFSFKINESVLNLSGGIEAESYLEHKELNQVSATKNFLLSPDRPIALTSRFSLSPSARYLETNDLVRRNAIIGGPATGLSDTPVPVAPRQKTKEFSGSIKTTYLATQKAVLGLEIGGDFQQVENQTTNLADSDSLKGMGMVDYRITPRSTVGILLRTIHTSSDLKKETDEYSAELTGKYTPAPAYSIAYRAGGKHIVEKFEAENRSERSFVPSGRVDFGYSGGTFTGNLSGEYEKSASGNFGSLSERGTVRLNLAEQLSPYWRISFSSYYQTARFKLDGNTEDGVTLFGSMNILYALAKWISIKVSSTSTRAWQHNPLFAFEEGDRHSVSLGFDASKEISLY